MVKIRDEDRSYLIKTHAPDRLQWVPLSAISPSENNPRLYMDTESLEDLRDLYSRHNAGEKVVLPDPLLVRWTPDGPTLFELLSGERRTWAATDVGIRALPCRVVTMSDEEAYRFVLEANHRVDLTTVELAYRASQMDALGFSEQEISEALEGADPRRYIAVGKMIDPNDFTSAPKLCNPSITTWFEATCFGQSHFETCFQAWNSGVWDGEECEKHFRQRGVRQPLDNKQKGLRLSVSKDGREINVIGKIPLDMYDNHELLEVVNRFSLDLQATARQGLQDRTRGFGKRFVKCYNPDTLAGSTS